MSGPVHADDPIVSRLRALAEASPDLRDAARVYERILPAVRDADLHVAPVTMTAEDARDKLEGGFPLLHGLDLDLDVSAFRALLLRLCTAVEAAREEAELPEEAARHLRAAIEGNVVEIATLLRGVASGDVAAVGAAAARSGLDASLLWTLAQNAFRPALRAWARQVSHLVGDGSWTKGACPVCGASAALAELQGNTQAKHLRCFQCGTDWAFPRLRCAYCGNDDHRTLGVLYDEGKQGAPAQTHRVETCEKCRGYLKVVLSFDPAPAEQLGIVDLETLHLDLIARSGGYTRPA